MRISIIVLALILSVTAAHAQTWEELRAMRKETTVRIHEVGRKSWFWEGKLLLVKDCHSVRRWQWQQSGMGAVLR
jgi:hypothetical protein